MNALPDLGSPLIAAGVVLFVLGFVQVYGAKIGGLGLVTGGLYRLARHPQYVGLALVGLGAFLVWPRVLVLVAYVTMLCLYGRLAGWEETRCLARFGEAYRAYQRRTGMFLPRPLPRLIPWPAAGERRVRAGLGLWLVVVAASVGIGYQVRDYALRHLSAFYTEDMAVLSPARLPAEALRTAVQVAASEAEVRDQIGPSGPGAKLLVYVLPEAWRIPDLPLNTPLSAAHPSTHRGHHVPFDFDPPATVCSSHGCGVTLLTPTARRSSGRPTGVSRSSWSASISRRARSPGSRPRHRMCCGATSRHRSSEHRLRLRARSSPGRAAWQGLMAPPAGATDGPRTARFNGPGLAVLAPVPERCR